MKSWRILLILVKRAKQLGYRVYFKKEYDMSITGVYLKSCYIQIGTRDSTITEVIAALAHEIGHIELINIKHIYYPLSNWKVTKDMLREELKASVIGLRTLKLLGLPIQAYKAFLWSAYLTYKEDYEHTNWLNL